jgi:hypothetical protein
MPLDRIEQLREWDTYKTTRKQSIDTLWAPSSFLSVIRVKRRLKRMQGYPGYVGHFSSSDVPILERYLSNARKRIGERAKIIIRGGATLLKDTDPPEAIAILQDIQRGERRRFIQAFEIYGYRPEQMDIVWAADNEGTKIIYHARTGIAKVLTQKLDAHLMDIEDLPPVFDE